MTTATTAEQAERLSRRRARLFPILAIFYLVQQLAFFSSPPGERGVDHVRIGAWVAMSLVLLLALMTGGSWLRGKEVRAILNDEVSRAHRADALGVGFVAATLTGIALYLLLPLGPVTTREAIHLIVSIGIFGALLRFGMLERRAHQGA